MDDQTLLLAVALLLSLVGVGWACYEHGYSRGHDAHQCEDELRLVAQARGRHPSRPEPLSRLDVLDGLDSPDRPPAGLPPAGGSAGRSGTYPDEMAP